MTDAVPSEPAGQAPATPGASAPEDASTSPEVGSLLTAGDQPAAPTAEPAKPAEAPAAPVIPDKYEFKAAEGVELDAELLEGMSPILKKIGLTQENAQSLVDGFNEVVGKLNVVREEKAEADFKQFLADASKKNVDAMKKEWGNNFAANLQVAQRGIARFLSAEAKAILTRTGLENHPEFVKAFYQIGQMIQEDTPPTATVPAANGASKLFTKSLGVN